VNRNAKVLLASSYLWSFGEGLLGPLYAVFAQQVGGDILGLTGAYSLYLLVMGASMIAVGRLADTRFSSNHMMVLGYGLNALGTFGYLLVDGTLKLFAVQALLGVATALASPTWSYEFARSIGLEHTGGKWGVAYGVPRIIFGIAVVLGGLTVRFLGFPALFVAMGSVQTVATLVQAQSLRAA
jgi:hypothetical protein